MTAQQLKIGIVCYPTYGGSGAVAAELGRVLARRGHIVHFISYSRPFRILHDFHENIYYHQVDTMEYPLFLGPLYAITASVRIYDIIRENQLDVLHVHYALPHGVCAFLANEMLPPAERVPVLTTLHGTDITLIGNSPAFKPAVKLGLDKSHGVTCVSKWLSDRTCKHFDICERLNIIYNFIDPELFKPGDPGIERAHFAKPGEALLIHVSNFRPVKRIEDVIRSFAMVNATLPSQLLLIGDGPERDNGMRLAAELGVMDRVRCLGEQIDVKNFFRLADLLLFPSDGESFGLAAGEAMACEMPVIGARAGGLPELCLDGENGFLYAVGDTQGMAEGALMLLQDEAKRKSMGKAGRQRILDHFAPELIVPKYEQYYYTLLRRFEQARGGRTPAGEHAQPLT